MSTLGIRVETDPRGEDDEGLTRESPSLSSSLTGSNGFAGDRVCTRAWRRMLLSTLKLRPQDSTGQTKAGRGLSIGFTNTKFWGPHVFLQYDCSGVSISLSEKIPKERGVMSYPKAAWAIKPLSTVAALIPHGVIV